MNKLKIIFSVFALSLTLFSCDKDDDTTTVVDKTDDVLEIPVRQVPVESTWYNALTTMNQNLASEKGIIATREFKSIFSVAPYNSATGQPYDKVFFGLSQYENKADYDAIVAKYTTGTPPSWLTNYFTTNTPLTQNSILVKKYRNTPNIDVKNFLSAGQVLEIAIRDVSGFSNFNDFDTKRAAFVDLLKQQDGFVKELEYRSEDGKYYVGMTIYENIQKFQTIATNPAVMQSAVAGALFSSYPPDVNQFGLAYP